MALDGTLLTSVGAARSQSSRHGQCFGACRSARRADATTRTPTFSSQRRSVPTWADRSSVRQRFQRSSCDSA